MPDKISVDRIRQLLQEARSAIDTLSSALGKLEGELEVLEQEAEEAQGLGLGDRAEVPRLTPEELGIASVKMLLTFQEAAALLSVSVAAVKDMVDQGELPVCKIGRKARIPVKQLQEHIKAARTGEGEGRGTKHPTDPRLLAPWVLVAKT